MTKFYEVQLEDGTNTVINLTAVNQFSKDEEGVTVIKVNCESLSVKTVSLMSAFANAEIPVMMVGDSE
ncbi:MAG: hypothetical protein ACRC6V_19405 [Bacteroidales bacterium]